MSNALLRAPEIFFTSIAGGRHRTPPIHFGQLRMPVAAPKRNGGRLSARFNGGMRKITFSAKAEADQNDGGNSLDEDGDLTDDLFEYIVHSDDENIFLEHPYYRCPDYNKYLNIWWDAGSCPPPLNFDISKIGINVVEFLRRIDEFRPIYFRVFGNVGELLPKMANDTVRIFSKSGFKLAGFELKDESNVSDFILAGLRPKRKYFFYGSEENLMIGDLIYHNIINHPHPTAYHMVVIDGKVTTTSSLDQLRLPNECKLWCIVPEQEQVDGVWRWKPLWRWD